MKKMNKKGFTIVELVIVIAVIAILAGVMIPTFTGIVDKAQQSAIIQEARNIYTEVYAEDLMDGVVNGKNGSTTIVPESGNYYVDANGKGCFRLSDGKWTAIFNGDSWEAVKGDQESTPVNP